MSQIGGTAVAEGPVDPTQIRYLAPEMCRIHLGAHDALHVTVSNDRIYGGVYASRIFPVGHPSRYISLIHVGPGGVETEIGVIRNLNDFPPEAVELVGEALARRYFVRTITRIHKVGLKYGFIALEVETDKGPASFFMYWQRHRAVTYGAHGKILLDVDDNRYVIPDLGQLSTHELAEFQRYIYW